MVSLFNQLTDSSDKEDVTKAISGAKSIIVTSVNAVSDRLLLYTATVTLIVAFTLDAGAMMVNSSSVEVFNS